MSATYSIKHYQHIREIEDKHFWFIARSELLKKIITRYMPKIFNKTFLEVGCGTGKVIKTLESMGLNVTGLDVNAKAIDYARKNTHAQFIRQSFHTLKERKKYDAVGMFDVVEHVTDDTNFFRKAYQLLKFNGYLFLTIPAGMKLWNAIDDASGHKRRYEPEELTKKLELVGFTVNFINFWSVLTMPFFLLFRQLTTSKMKQGDLDGYLSLPHPILNFFFLLFLHLENLVIFQIKYHSGATLIVCAQKKK